MSERTMYELVRERAKVYADRVAVEFLGRRILYPELIACIDRTADGLRRIGVRPSDVVTLCLPNTPHAVIAFYAANRLGCVANMVHPLSPPEELAHSMAQTRSRVLVVLDAFLPKHRERLERDGAPLIVSCSLPDYLPWLKGRLFRWTMGRKIPKVVEGERLFRWSSLSGDGSVAPYEPHLLPGDPAVYLHSGGTTGAPKTIVLSSMNFNLLALEGPAIIGLEDTSGQSMVSILPFFHGFGLCMGMHAMVVNGILAILVPKFSAEELAKVVRKCRPTLMAGVPTLFDGMLRNPRLRKADLSNLRAVFCGGDTLPVDLKRRFDAFLQERGAKCTLREGYGLTETVTVCCVNPIDADREGSVGLPLRGVRMAIVEPGTENLLPAGWEGEICVNAPTTMLGYLDDPAATDVAVWTHEDGLRWVHTGDFGSMDVDGYVHFKQRLKRIIKVSGVPVFPSQIEDTVMEMEEVAVACAVGAPDLHRMQTVHLYVVPAAGIPGDEALEEKIRSHCQRHLLIYSVPTRIIFRGTLPLTLVGKTDVTALEKEAALEFRP